MRVSDNRKYLPNNQFRATENELDFRAWWSVGVSTRALLIWASDHRLDLAPVEPKLADYFFRKPLATAQEVKHVHKRF